MLNKKPKIPFKTPFLIIMVILWNLLLIPYFYDAFFSNTNSDFKVEKALLPLLFVLVVAILILVSKGFQKLVLRKGKSIDIAKPFVYFIIVLMTLMCIVIILLALM